MTKGTVKKQYSRKELLRNAFIPIRASIRNAQDFKQLGNILEATHFLSLAIARADMLYIMNILSLDKYDFLRKIIEQMYSEF